MAAGSFENWHIAGKKSLEYKVIQNHLSDLVLQCQHALEVLANELFSTGMISQLEHENAISSSMPAYHRATNMIKSVLAKIEKIRSYYSDFILALRKAELEDVAVEVEHSRSKLERQFSLDSAANQGSHERVFPSRSYTDPSSRLECSTAASSEGRGHWKSQPSPGTTVQTSQGSYMQGSNVSCPVQGDSLDTAKPKWQSHGVLGHSVAISSSQGYPVQSETLTPVLNLLPSDNFTMHSNPGDAKAASLPSYNISSPSAIPESDFSSLRQHGKSQQCSHPIGGSLYVGQDKAFPDKPALVAGLNRRRGSHGLYKEIQSSCASVRRTNSGELLGNNSAYRRCSVSSDSHPSSSADHEVQMLRKSLQRRGKVIDLLRDDIAGMEDLLNEEQRKESAFIHEVQFLKAEKRKVTALLVEKVADRDKVIAQLQAEKVENEKQIEQLKLQFAKTVETRSTEANEISKCHQYKVASLMQTLYEIKQQEKRSKEEFVSIDSSLTKSELSIADELAPLAEKGNEVVVQKVPKWKKKLELEERRAIKEKDFESAKEAGDLIKKLNHLLDVRRKSTDFLATMDGTIEDRWEKLESLNLMTPDTSAGYQFDW